MTDPIAEQMRRIDAEVLRPGGWDAPATLYAIQREGDGLMPLRLESFEQVAQIAPPGTPPFGLLSVYAQALSASPMGWPYDVVAVAIATEAWSVMSKTGDIARQDQNMAAARDRMIHARPDRVEIRIIVSVDRDGEVRALQYARGEDEVTLMSGGENALGGGVVDGLQAVLSALAP